MFFMIKKYAVLVLIAGSLVASGASVVFAQEPAHEHNTRQAARYYCPMHPQIVSDRPGECPICHMRLVLDVSTSPEGATSLEGRIPVTISDSNRALLDIRTQPVGKRHLRKTIETWGHVAHDPELYELQIEFFRAERLNYERERDRTPISQKRGLTEREKIGIQFLDMGLSPEWVEALEKTGVPDKRLVYHHNADGIWIFLQIREREATFLKTGEKVTIRPTGLEETKLDGTVEFIDSKTNPESGTVRVWALVQNPPSSLRPDMAVSASIAVDLGEVLAVPEDAPLFTGSRALMFVEEAGVFKPREVSLGANVDGYYEVKEGLMPGEKVALSGNFFIDSESRIRSAVAGASHEGHKS